ncbi:MAG: M20/M25/M40 family metallo-hydrolase [Candidatus Hydrogenedentes bacterium]|nr:M20/M25/M40 family metallo-hydrolase [Candidatus Hydrogenedentota bacterium]
MASTEHEDRYRVFTIPPEEARRIDEAEYFARKPRFTSLFVLVFLVGVGAASLIALRPPAPLASDAPATEFSALRAIQHNYVIATEPHPSGSPANDRVQAYIVDTLRSFGVDAQVVTTYFAEGQSAGRSNFILARIPGTGNTKAFGLMAHYDSTPYGPGAADDCSGVISLLEIAHVLKASPPLKNDIVFVFTDGEEVGLRGAKAFANHPWFNEVALMTNLESRGTQGNSLVFDTSEQNGWLVAELMRGMRYLCASSFMYDVYKMLPFSSDFDALRRHGMKGCDIAFIDNFAWYHTANDRPEHLNLATLQQHGSCGLDLARHFGSIPLDGTITAPDATYFNVFGYWLARYPLSWGEPLAFAVAAFVGLVLLIGLVTRKISVTGTIAGAVMLPITAAIAAAACVGILAYVWGPDIATRLYTENFTRIPDLTPLYHNALYTTSYVAASIAVASLIYGALSRWVSSLSLLAGAYVWWIALLFVLNLYLPGGSYAALWPLAISAAGTFACFLFSKRGQLRPGWIVFLSFFAAPAVLLFTPMYRSFAATVMIAGAPGFAAFVVLVLGLMIPQLDLMGRVNRWWLPALSTAVAIGLVTAGVMNSSFTRDRPKLDSVSYGIDYDANKAYWLSPDREPDEWTAQFFPPGTQRAQYSEFASSNEPVLKAPAPIAPEYPGPQVTIASDVTTNAVRELTLHIASPAKAASMAVRVQSDANVLGASLFSKTLATEERGLHVDINVFPPEGVDLALRLAAGGPVTVNARETFYGLPSIPGIKPRPDYIIASPNTVDHGGRALDSNRIFVTRTVHF